MVTGDVSALAFTIDYKDPGADLMGASLFPAALRPAGLTVCGHDPNGALLSAR